MTYWCKSEEHPTFESYRISRDVDEVFAKISAPEGCVFHYCRCCKEITVWRKGIALVNRWTNGRTTDPSKWGRGEGIFPSNEADMRAVDKCTSCGRSLAAGAIEARF